MKSEAALKQAVQQQLDLILKIEQERKLLKRENKLLKEQHQKMLNIVKKYNQQKKDMEVNTEQQQIEKIVQKIPQKAVSRDQFVQVDMDLHSNNISKLTEAQELLKKGVVNQSSLCSRCEMGQILEPIQQQPKNKKPSNSEQISGEIVKMAKEIATLKRQLVQSESKYKGRQKQIKQLKKCLEVKSEALQKSRKQFNQLSNILNTDKYKSVRNLENELAQTKSRLAFLQQQSKHSVSLRKALQDVTHEYEFYRQDRESKIQRLTWQLKEKDSRCEQLSRVMDTLRLENSFQ